MQKLNVDWNDPRMRAAAAILVNHGADKHKKLVSEEARDRKAVNAAVEAFWKKAPLATRRAFLAQLEGYASERNVARIQRFATNLTEVPQAPAPTTATSIVSQAKDAGKAE